jgi:peptidyl-dipeptidase Dcp
VTDGRDGEDPRSGGCDARSTRPGSSATRGDRTTCSRRSWTARRSSPAADWAFYTEKVRIAKYDVDTAQMRPCFEEPERDFFCATASSLPPTRSPRGHCLGREGPSGVPSGCPRLRVRSDDSPVGWRARPLHTRLDHKRAWMNPLISQNSAARPSRDRREQPSTCPNLPAGEPTLLTYDRGEHLLPRVPDTPSTDCSRGHPLPKFARNQRLPTSWSFRAVEQEMWMPLARDPREFYAVHCPHQTRRADARSSSSKVQSSSLDFNQVFKTSEYLAARCSARLAPSRPTTPCSDVAEFEAEALTAVRLDNPAVPTRYSSAYFTPTPSPAATTRATTPHIWSECWMPTYRRLVHRGAAASRGRTATVSGPGCSEWADRGRIRSGTYPRLPRPGRRDRASAAPAPGSCSAPGVAQCGFCAMCEGS